MPESKITYLTFVVEENPAGNFTRRVVPRQWSELPEGEVLVRVKYSSLNYKDALSAVGNKGVTKQYPHTPGIDAGGIVEDSSAQGFRPGDPVLVNSPELGVSAPGGFSQYLRVPASWLLPLPERLTLRQAMVYGTAGFTAALCVDRLMKAGIKPDQGEILVTGATGGVGSIAVGILAREKYHITAATGKMENNRLLRTLGAADVINRSEINDTSGRPLLHSRWAAVVDTLGGNFLATAIRALQPGGVVTACGNAASADLPLTVFPFILRGVQLIGIDSTRVARKDRLRLWNKLGGRWKLRELDELGRDVKLEDLDEEIQKLMQGGGAGRVVVKLDD